MSWLSTWPSLQCKVCLELDGTFLGLVFVFLACTALQQVLKAGHSRKARLQLPEEKELADRIDDLRKRERERYRENMALRKTRMMWSWKDGLIAMMGCRGRTYRHEYRANHCSRL
jgi:hypothetical protein